MKNRAIYLDYMATTPVDPLVITEMSKYLGPEGEFGNPSSITHLYGRTAARAVDEARLLLAETIGAESNAIIFTSGATEANNLAILGAARFYQNKGRHIITMSTEHKTVLDSMHQLESEGFKVTYLDPRSDGLLDLSVFEQALRDDTILVSVMHVNNEVGVIQDIAAIGNLLRGRGIVFHVDAAQSAGKLAIDLQQLPVDLMSFSAHKIYGPKGVGALYIRQKPRIRLQAQSFGGGQENGLRSGTLATHQIVGMGKAFALAYTYREEEQKRQLALRERLWAGIEHLPGVRLNGHREHRVAGNLNITFAGIPSQTLLTAFNGLALSTTSACESMRLQPSYVLRALGLPAEDAYCAIRLSVGRFTTDNDVQQAIEIICNAGIY